jgi:flagellar basal-body rod protein FlgF/flagellar basal-body rod protein FlgG
VTVSSEGVISVAGAAVSSLGLWTFASPDALVPEGANNYLPQSGIKPESSRASVRQGSLEGSNQDVMQGTLQLILVQRQAEMMQKALTVFNNDFDKTASEDLPRV